MKIIKGIKIGGLQQKIFNLMLFFPVALIGAFFPDSAYSKFVEKYFAQTSIVYMVVAFVLIIAFNYFYIAIQYNAADIAKQMRENGGTIPGIRPGIPTINFIMNSVNKVTLFGALFLGVVAVLPYVIQRITGIENVALGGTSMLILVSVALETVRILEAQMIQRNMPSVLD